MVTGVHRGQTGDTSQQQQTTKLGRSIGMSPEEFCARVNSEAVLGHRSWGSAKALTDAVMSILATFPDSEIESHDGPDPDELKDEPPPDKQRDLFEPPDEYDQNWEEFLQKLNDPKQ